MKAVLREVLVSGEGGSKEMLVLGKMALGTRRLIGRGLLVGSLALGLMVIGVQAAAAATTWYVNSTTGLDSNNCMSPTTACKTIQAAVNKASSGDTINVAAGTYPELVTVDKTLTFLGPQQGVDARTRAVPVTSEAVVGAPDGAFQIEADKVVIDGFTIQGVVSNPSAPPFTGLGAGIWTNPGFSGTQGGHQILNNIIQLNIVGIYLNNTCAFGTLVRFNLIRDNTVPGPASGNGIYSDLGLCNAVIDKNKFSGNGSGSVLVIGPASNISITNNELVAPSPESISFLGVSTSTISGNVSTGSTSNATIDLFGGDSGVTITGNTLLNGIRAIQVEDPFGAGQNSDIAAHQNCIRGNSAAGMEVDPLAYPMTPQLNAENNWWGDPSGPNEIPRNTSGTGDRIIDLDQNVDFVPWLTLPTAPPCPQPPPPNTPGKVTGGGQVQGDPIFSLTGDLLSLPALVPSLASPASQATFGFTVTCCAPTGNLEYDDHPMDVRIKAQSISGLFISSPGTSCPATPGSKHARFTGSASVIRSTGTTTQNFTVNVDDCGEPGTSDTFSIQTFGTPPYSSGPNTLIGGNIQIH
jgi:hypothetical protein